MAAGATQEARYTNGGAPGDILSKRETHLLSKRETHLARDTGAKTKGGFNAQASSFGSSGRRDMPFHWGS